MAYPYTGSEVRRPDIEGVLEEFDVQADRVGFVASRLLPVLDVEVDGGRYEYIPLEELLQADSDLARAPGSSYQRADFTWKQGLFQTQELGIEVEIDDKMRNRHQNFPMEVESAKFARDRVLRHIEIAVATALINTDTFSSYNVTTAWDVPASATPIKDINTIMETMFSEKGVYPNTLLINEHVYRNLLACDQITANLKGVRDTSQGKLGAADLASAFGIDNVIVAGGAKNTAARGQSAVISHIWGSDYAMLLKTMDDASSPYSIGVGRLLHYSADGSAIGGTIETYRDNAKRCDVLRCRLEATPKIYYPECGYLIGGITTTAE